MDEVTAKMLEELSRKIEVAMEPVRELKKAANLLAKSQGYEQPFSEEEMSEPKSGIQKIRFDQFTNYSGPSAAARAFLDFRGKDRGAATIDEIYRALWDGGFPFHEKDDSNNKGALSIALGKDKKIYRNPTNGAYGLAEWYPNARRTRSIAGNGGSSNLNDADDENIDESDGDDAHTVALEQVASDGDIADRESTENEKD
ncbi:hypothetical protein K8I61_17200 [bacterium]|nr:hypothetical protein [bacterium]